MDQAFPAFSQIAPGATRAPIPAWVDLEPYDRPASPNPHFVANGLCVLLDESQIDLCGPERAWFYRRAELITAHAGAERAAQFEASFDPNFERLEVHTVRVLRGEKVIEYQDAPGFEVFRRERNMERLIFDGRLTVHFTIPDVRAGDIVEIAYTTYGMRKSLGGRHTAWIALEWSVGIIDVRVRQRVPAHRVIAEKAFHTVPSATQTEADGVIDRRWRSRERRGIQFEPLTPPWTLQHATVQFSEWKDWAEVAEVFAPVYEEDGPLPAEIEVECARIEATEDTPAKRAAAILRFAQGAVRYLAISIGEGGYTPRSLADICDTRYGDCKDKSKLFVAMAKRLGLDACCALVNTRDGYVVNTWLPSAQVFDHCIVRLTLDGRVYWLDATRSLQPSPLEKVNQCHLGWALPLARGTTDIERMEDPSPAHTLEAHEHITIGESPDNAVRYEWRITSRRGRAEMVREQIAREGEIGLFKHYAQDVQRTYAKAMPVKQAIESDDHAQNVVTGVEVYEILDAWTANGGDLYSFSTLDLTMRSNLSPLDAGVRKHPIYLGQVGQVTRRVVIDTASAGSAQGWSRTIESTSLVYKTEMKRESPTRMVLEQSLDFKALTLPAAEADKYRAIVADLEKSDVMISERVNKKGYFAGVKQKGGGWNWFWAIWIPLVLAYWAWRLLSETGTAP